MDSLQSTEESREVQLDEAAQEIQAVASLYINVRTDRLNKLKQRIRDILFEEQGRIPEGVYIKLMDVLK